MEKLTTNSIMPCNHTSLLSPHQFTHPKPRTVSVLAGKSLNTIFNSCKTCGGKSAIDCPGCKGTGRNKKNGNIFERWKCYDCQGFGMKSCPSCGKGGLTPEQRGER
ncbi:hypothetical protein M5689_024903 [Euphorbia peplus]|nr:hypothetical protein M5689_024903 [Euphorbia peplus]